MDELFEVGDRVVITEGVKRCFFNHNEDMVALIGTETEITERSFSGVRKVDKYRIAADRGRWAWSENCFELVEPEYEIEISDDEFAQIVDFLMVSDGSSTPPRHRTD